MLAWVREISPTLVCRTTVQHSHQIPIDIFLIIFVGLREPVFLTQKSFIRAFILSPISFSLSPIPNHPKHNYNDIYRRFWRLNITTIIFLSKSKLLKLRPEGIVVLVLAGLLLAFRIVLDEPCEELGVVNLLAEHFLAAFGIKSATLFCWHSH